MNLAIIIGNLGKDPEKAYTKAGDMITKFTVATSDSFTGKDGKKKETTEWHNIAVFGRAAESCYEYLKKGRLVKVEGRIQTDKYEDKEGNIKYSTSIIARDVKFLGGGNDKRNE